MELVYLFGAIAIISFVGLTMSILLDYRKKHSAGSDLQSAS